MAGLTPTGFETKSLEEIQSEISADLKAGISSELDTEAPSPTGVAIGIFSRQLRKLWELGEALHAMINPAAANGFALATLSSLTGTDREAARTSTVVGECNLDPGNYPAGALIAHVASDPTARFVSTETVVNGGGSAADFDVDFESESAGPVRANAGTLTVIAEPVSGWNSVTNALDADLGALEESDSALRLRRQDELTQGGSTMVDAIRADILDVEGVTSATVLENDTDVTNVDGLVPHSVEAIVIGGDDTAILTALLKSKAAGINTNGAVSETILDSQGIAHTVRLTRPTVLTVYLDVFLTVDALNYGGDELVKTVLSDWGDANLFAGFDVKISRLKSEIFRGVPGVIDVTLIEAGFSASPTIEANLNVLIRQIADIDTGRIVVTSTPGSFT